MNLFEIASLAVSPRLLCVYWVRGTMPKGHSYQNTVKDPPCSGWQFAILLPRERRSVLFCPFTFQSYVVPNDCDEIRKASWIEGFVTTDLVERMQANWTEFQTLGYERDYNTAVAAFKALGADVPEQLMKGGEEDDRERGGKPVADRLLKPVRKRGKRGAFLLYFLDNEGTRSIREVMAEFGMTRSNALSYLYTLNRDNGVGYTLVGDSATVELPCDVEEVWAGALRKEV